jgi:hypothetical protein
MRTTHDERPGDRFIDPAIIASSLHRFIASSLYRVADSMKEVDK